MGKLHCALHDNDVVAEEVSFDSAVLVFSASFCCSGWEIKNKNSLLPFL